MHVVCMVAHPDDEGMCGGTLAKYAQRGHKVTIVIATHGERGHFDKNPEELKKIRTEEAKKSAKVLGADVVFLDYVDADVPAPEDMKDVFVDVVRKLKPDIVFTWHPMTDRDDHRNVGQAVYDACFKASLPLVKTKYSCTRIPRIYHFDDMIIFPTTPHAYVDITDVLQQTIEAAKQHKSQMDEWLPWSVRQMTGVEETNFNFDITKFVESRARKKGEVVGVKYAETFVLLQSLKPKRPLNLIP